MLSRTALTVAAIMAAAPLGMPESPPDIVLTCRAHFAWRDSDPPGGHTVLVWNQGVVAWDGVLWRAKVLPFAIYFDRDVEDGEKGSAHGEIDRITGLFQLSLSPPSGHCEASRTQF